MRLEDLNWMDVEAYLKRDDRIILILGSTEQHGYLSLATDTRIAQALADAASKKTGVPIAPALPFGVSPYFEAYPGTLSLSLQTYVSLVEELVRSFHRQGLRGVMIVIGHGGNLPALAALSELANELLGLRLGLHAWFEESAVTAVAERHHLRTDHASWSEAFSFTRVAELPLGEKEPVVVPPMTSAAETRRLLGDGVFGGAYQASDAVMQELFDAALSSLVEALDRLKAPQVTRAEVPR
jgi:creatinine amidohydrolase